MMTTAANAPARNLMRPGEELVPTHCPFCGMQCAMYMRLDRATGKVVGVEPRYDFPVNGGRMCPKGVVAFEQINHPERLTRPLIRKNGELQPASWDEALDLVAGRFRELQGRYGKDTIGLYGGVSMTNEKCYVAGKFARVALGTRNIDYNGRFCMSSAAAGANKAVGIDRGLFNPWNDVELAEVIILGGSNTAECHPTAIGYIWRARDNGARLVVIDPRRTPTARLADVHLALRPGTDSALVNGLLHVLIRDNLIDQAFIDSRTRGFEAMKELVMRDYAPDQVARITGVKAELIEKAAHIYGEAKTGMVMYARGAEQQSKGVDNVLSYINLMLVTGKIGKPGCGGGTLTGQGNGQGGREHGQKADQLPGYRKISDPEARAYICKVWGIDESELPGAGCSAYELLQAMGRSEVRALYLYCSNPLVSAPDNNSVRQFLENLDFLVVADFFLSESAALADVVLPAAVWAEDDGTTTNAEGRVIRSRKAQEPVGEAKPDWWIMREISRRLGRGQYFDYESPQDIFEELRLASKGGPADYSGITYERIERENGVFWPAPEDDPGADNARMFTQRFAHPDGRAMIHAVPYRPAGEVPDAEYPYYLTTGRLVFHYLSGTQTRRLPFLMQQAPEPFVEVHPDLAARLGLVHGGKARLRTRRGDMALTVKVTATIRPDTVFVPYHWGDRLSANQLTNPALDPVSRMPEFKTCAVAIEPVS